MSLLGILAKVLTVVWQQGKGKGACLSSEMRNLQLMLAVLKQCYSLNQAGTKNIMREKLFLKGCALIEVSFEQTEPSDSEHNATCDMVRGAVWSACKLSCNCTIPAGRAHFIQQKSDDFRTNYYQCIFP